jgi:integrase
MSSGEFGEIRPDDRRFRTFIIGAGFSVPAGLPLAGELWREVLSRADKLPGVHNFIRDDLNRFREFKAATGQEEPPDDEIEFEEFLGYLDIEHFLWLQGSDTFSSAGNKGQLLIRWLIGQILWERQQAGRSSRPEAYRRFADQIRGSDYILTFNYDTLIEEALESVGRPYRLFPDRLESVEPLSATIDSSRDEVEVVVLKLHGSIDWFDRRGYEELVQTLAAYAELTDDDRVAEAYRREPRHPVFGRERIAEASPILEGPRELDARGHTVTNPDMREPVGPRIVAKDLKALRAACRRAAIERTNTGAFALAADPTRGLELPVERNPRRPIVDAARVEALMAVADQVKMRVGWGKAARWVPSPLPTLLRLAADTGRRASAILALRASDWRPELGTYGKLLWRADSDKVGRDWLSPVTPEVRTQLERYRRERLLVGDAPFFPAPNNPARPVKVEIASDWLRRAEKLAGLEPLPGGIWHPFRRRWATERKHLSLKDVAAVGGWTDTQTLQKCYQVADEETMEAVVLQPRRLRRLG